MVCGRMSDYRKVEFTEHAKLKLRILRKHGFMIEENKVVETIIQPDKIILGRMGRLIAQKRLDKEHVLRVIYETEDDKLKVITLYPARRERYED